MDFGKLKILNERLENVEDNEEILKEYLELFKNCATSINSKNKYDEETYYFKILLNKKIQKNKFRNYKSFVALLVSKISTITEDWEKIIKTIKTNINDENIDVFYKCMQRNTVKYEYIQNFVEEYNTKFKYENRKAFLDATLFCGEKASFQEKDFYYGSCKTARKDIDDLAMYFRQKPGELAKYINQKIEEKEIMDLHKIVYRYLEITSDFDTEVLYNLSRFLFKNKMARVVDEIFELYIDRFKCVPYIDINFIMYVMAFSKGSKKRSKISLYTRATEIYLSKNPDDLIMAQIYISQLGEEDKYKAKNFIYATIARITKREDATAFIRHIVKRCPKQWEVKTSKLESHLDKIESIKLQTIYESRETARKIYNGSLNEINAYIDKCIRNKNISQEEYIINVIKILTETSEKSETESLFHFVDYILKAKISLEYKYKYEAIYYTCLYELGKYNEKEKEELKCKSLYDREALSTYAKLCFYDNYKNENYDECIKNVKDIIDVDILLKLAIKLLSIPELDVKELYNFIDRKIVEKQDMNSTDEKLISIVEIKEKLKLRSESNRNRVAISSICKDFNFEEDTTIRNVIKKNFSTKDQEEVYKVLETISDERLEKEVECKAKSVNCKIDTDEKKLDFKSIGVVFSLLDKRFITAYPKYGE